MLRQLSDDIRVVSLSARSVGGSHGVSYRVRIPNEVLNDSALFTPDRQADYLHDSPHVHGRRMGAK